jgi:hypothetical protein
LKKIGPKKGPKIDQNCGKATPKASEIEEDCENDEAIQATEGGARS